MVMPGFSLALDGAASIGTVAVLRDDLLVSERTVEMRSAEEERFFPAVLDALGESGVQPSGVDRIICGAGPGSFTSLRVVAAVAKGLALGAGRPLFPVPSLALIVAAFDGIREFPRWLASLDAMRGERYLALVEVGPGGGLARVDALGRAAAVTCDDRARELGARLIGPDEATRSLPHARGVVRCLDLVSAAGPVDLATWEPAYGRLAEAQVRWESIHGRPLDAGGPPA